MTFGTDVELEDEEELGGDDEQLAEALRLSQEQTAAMVPPVPWGGWDANAPIAATVPRTPAGHEEVCAGAMTPLPAVSNPFEGFAAAAAAAVAEQQPSA